MHKRKHIVIASHDTCRQTNEVVPLKGCNLAERLAERLATIRAPAVVKALGMSISARTKHGSNLEARALGGPYAQLKAARRPGWRRIHTALG